ncbi:MAG: hypothetical protein ABFD79_05695 [Phycisphaerales bacterium]
MEEKQLHGIITLIVPQLIALIAEKQNVDELQATEELYQSELYALLENEDTKLWHLSPLTLYEMFAEEKQTGQITFPEEA